MIGELIRIEKDIRDVNTQRTDRVGTERSQLPAWQGEAPRETKPEGTLKLDF